MPKFIVPTAASIHSSHSFLFQNNFFEDNGSDAVLEFHPSYFHLEPMALSMIAAWGAWCHRLGKTITVTNLTKLADYAARMKLFEHLGIDYTPQITEHEESGRFLPIRNVKSQKDISGVLADVSALLHLNNNPDSLAAAQYCMSELLRNVLEHSDSPDGAFVCAHNYTKKRPRVTLAVADCGCGITNHLSRKYPEIDGNDMEGLHLAMLPGVTGAMAGMYGTPDNAGAGLFITRSIAKGTGGYFEIISGNAAYRLYRSPVNDQALLSTDPFLERSDQWLLPCPWLGTVVTLEIDTNMVNDFESFFEWMIVKIPPKTPTQKKIRFT